MGAVTPLPDTDAGGLRSLGMSLFLVSSTMMFGGLLLLHANLRHDAPSWPPAGIARVPTELPLLATLVIAASSLTLHAGVSAVRRARPHRLVRWLAATLLLGAAFGAIEIALWRDLWAEGFRWGNPYGGTFYVLTGFHAAHVAVALGLLLWLLPGALRTRYHGRDNIRVRLVARFWHFLGINWALLFLAFFIL